MHGGNIYKHIEEYGKKPIDFSANVNPYPLPSEVVSEIQDSINDMAHYPDPDCIKLREALSKKLSVDCNDVLCGAGASDLIYRFICALRPKSALIIEPAFLEYEKALNLYGCGIKRYYLNEDADFVLSEDILDHITDDTELLIINAPHNPTGIMPDKTIIGAICDKCKKLGIYLLCDESFLDFLDDTDDRSIIHYGYDKVISIRAFTKYYGLAGLRLGYVVSRDHTILAKMQQAGPIWNVSVPAQAAGVSLLSHEYRINADIAAERDYLFYELTSLGCRVIHGSANFILFYSDDAELDLKLKEKSILIRDCSDFNGLSEGWYRIAVRTHDENIALIEAMESLLNL